MKKYIFSFTIIILFGISVFLLWNHWKFLFYPKELQSILRSAPKREEYQHLLTYYRRNKEDSLKYRSLCFLLENLPGKFSCSGSRITCLEAFFDTVENVLAKRKALPDIEKLKAYWYVIRQHCSGDITIVPDIDTVGSDFLKTVIDESFKTWENTPYSRYLSFHNFEEYILPYRSNHEKCENNYVFIKKRYSWLSDSLKNKTDPVEACKLVNDDLKSWFRFEYYLNNYPTDISISDLYRSRIGICRDMANLACVTMRILGIPVAVDYTPQWGNKEKGHLWNVVFDTSMKAIPFMGAESNPGEESSYFFNNIPAKIYRITWRRNLLLNERTENIPPLFLTNNQIDVTGEYTAVSNVVLEIDRNRFPEKYACLSVFSRSSGWNPICIGKISTAGQVCFENMGRGVVYLPTVFNDDRNIPVDNPFILSEAGQRIPLIPNHDKTTKIKLARKYPLYPHILKFVDYMIGGKFQGADNPTFKDATDLYCIKERPELFLQSVNIEVKKKFKYVRYIGPENGYSDIAEVEFYGEQGKLSGQIIGQSKWPIKEDAFDGNIDSFFATAESGSGEWLGLQLNVPSRICQVRFLPRNDNNTVKPGDRYELLYWDAQWVSLGVQTAKNNYLMYDHVPAYALLWLRNLDYGQEERIFTIEDGKQVWW